MFEIYERVGWPEPCSQLFPRDYGARVLAVLEMERARQVDPLSFIVNSDLCRMLYFSRRYDEALAQCKEILTLDSKSHALWRIGAIYAAKGMDAEAASVFLQAWEKDGASPAMMAVLKSGEAKSGLRGQSQVAIQYVKEDFERGNADPLDLAVAYTYAGDTDTALIWLDKAIEARSFGITYLGVDPAFDGLRSNPRFQDLLRRITLPQ